MKRFLLSMTCAAFAMGLSAAKPVMTAPGFERSARKSCKAQKAKLERKATLSRQGNDIGKIAMDAKSYTPKPCSAIVKAPARISNEDLVQMTDDRLTSMDAKITDNINKVENGYSRKYTYNDRGLIEKEILVSETNWGTVIQYGDNKNYVLNTYPEYYKPGIYSQKVSRPYEDGVEVASQGTEWSRTFHSNGNLKSEITTRRGEFDNENRFDENGYLVYSASKVGNNPWGIEKSVTTYHYFPLGKIWLQGRKDVSYQSTEVIIKDNSYVINTFERISVSDTEYAPKLCRMEEYFYSSDGQQSGHFNAEYDPYSGELRYAYGDRTISGKGNDCSWQEQQRYDSDTKSWVSEYRKEESLNYEEPWVYSNGKTRWEKTYFMNREDNSMQLYMSSDYSWLTEKIVKEVTNYVSEGESYIDYYMPENGELGEEIYYNEENGNYAKWEERDEWWDAEKREFVKEENDVFTYYYKTGAVAYQIMVIYKEYEPSIWRINKNGVWAICTGEHTIYEGNDYVVATFDSMGRLMSVNEYENGKFDEKVTYTYTTTGYIEEYWQLKEDGKTFWKESMREYSLKDDIRTETNFEYNKENGEIEYGHKNEYNIALKYTFYYIWEAGKFSKSYAYADPIETLLPDGKTETLYRDVNFDGTIVPVSKEIRKIEGDYNGDGRGLYEYWETYNYNSDTQKWIGNYKSEREMIELPAWESKYSTTFSSYGAIDYLKHPMDEMGVGSDEPKIRENYTYWSWDYERNDWGLQSINKLVPVVNGDKYKYTETTGDMSRITVIEGEMSRDKNGFLTEQNTTTVDSYYSSNGVGTPERETTRITNNLWNVDDKGRRISGISSRITKIKSEGQEETYSDEKTEMKFGYSKISFLGAGIADVVADAEDFTVNGRMITAGETVLEVFNMQGLRIATIVAGDSAMLPAGGLYIVRSSAESRKIQVK